MKNNCENPEYETSQGEVICQESPHFNKIVGDALDDLSTDRCYLGRKIWLSTVMLDGQRVQLQLVATRDSLSFIDEN